MRNEPFARIEDLDPEPPAAARQARRWEPLIGLLLVLGLVGLGGWQWWDQQARLAAYRAGAEAARQQDWDRAYSAYTRAGGYAAAPQRAADAGRIRGERDTQYRLARDAGAAGKWAAALQAIRRVQQIAPHYAYTERLARHAQEQVYMAALSGTVASRPQAAPPGLYAYGPAGWRWLQGSDAESRLRATCPDGALVFDAAGDSPPPLEPAPLPFQRAGAAAVRRLLVTTPAGAASARGPLAFYSGALYSQCTDSGLWTAQDMSEHTGVPIGLVPFIPSKWIYQAFGGPAVLVGLPTPAWFMWDMTPDGRHTLLLDATGITPDHLQSRLYLADPDGGQRRLLLDQPGGLLWSSFSPDGHYLLITTRAAETDTILLVDVTGGHPPWALAAGYQDRAQAYGGSAFAIFLDAGAHAGQALVTWADGTQQQIRLLDPNRPDHPLAAITTATAPGYIYPFTAAWDTAGFLLHAGTTQTAGTMSDLLIYIDPAYHAHPVSLPRSPTRYLGSAWLRGADLIYATQEPGDTASTPQPFTLFSLPLTHLDDALSGGTPIYTGTVALPARDGSSEPAPPTLHLGQGLLAYIAPGGILHARAYDGTIDLALEPGVTALYREAVYDLPYDVP